MSNENEGTSNEIRTEIDELKDQIKLLTEMMGQAPPKRKRRPKRSKTVKITRDAEDKGYAVKFNVNWAESIGEYVDSVMTSVAGNLERAMKAITFPTWDEDGKKTQEGGLSEEELEEFFEDGSTILSALSDGKRLRMLKALEDGPLYQQELSKQSNSFGGTFKHHMDKLLDARFVVQEAVRGRYIISREGLESLKLAELLFMNNKYTREDSTSTDEDLEEEE
ncbi:MAG: winged helix-turn-helix transcriptional regulator [Candidatus Heimdallarchaeota archaeon]|nr:winged helix-turn-helix transcriptional regulator [Candidatus Heimdallarchaeota archaeon]MCK5048383.1 winged helix-turn-helix transcriptional regulator [Candidatus Heimdallarchaeota archaeon]